MKIAVSGSRNITDPQPVVNALKEIIQRYDDGRNNVCIITGGARGVDTIAKDMAFADGIPYVEVPAQWDFYGRKAGSIRNNWILRLRPDIVVAFPTQNSIGTRHMINAARKLGIETIVHEM